MNMIKKRSDCPISSSLEIWWDKWSLLIIRDLMLAKKCTYWDFLKSSEKIATNILGDRLKILEENEIITRNEHPDSKAKILYKLTKKGIDLLPIIVEINLWAWKYLYISKEWNLLINSIKKNKDWFIKSAMDKLEEDLLI